MNPSTLNELDKPQLARPRLPTLVPYQGGKSRLAERIIAEFPTHTCYIEPFAGAGGIFFAKTASKVEVLNDLNGDLVCLYRVVQHHLEEFVRHFKWALASRQIYEWHKRTDPSTLTDIQRAARFFYLQKQGFAGKTAGRSFGTGTTCPAKINLLRLEEDLSALHLRLHQVYVENLPWQECIARYDRAHSFIYADPPYWQTAGYGLDFGWEQFEMLASAMAGIEGKMAVSINDHPDIRRLFAGHRMLQLQHKYQTSNGRVRNDQGATKGRGQVHELLIFNF